jgi:hypothetical protein
MEVDQVDLAITGVLDEIMSISGGIYAPNECDEEGSTPSKIYSRSLLRG